MGFFFVHQILPLALLWMVCMFCFRLDAVRKWGIPAILAGSLGLQMALLRWAPDPSNSPDSIGFLLLGHGLIGDSASILYRPRLYPFFLSLFSSSGIVLWAQILMKFCMALILWRSAHLLSLRKDCTAMALILFGTNALWLQEPLQILDTTLYAFFVTAFLWLLVENFLAFSPAAFLSLCAAAGLAGSTRQVGDFALILGLAVTVWRLRAHIRPGLLLRGSALALALGFSGAVANGLSHGVYQRSVALGVNLYTRIAYYSLADTASPEWDYIRRYLPAAMEGPAWDPSFTAPLSWRANALPHTLQRAMERRDGLSRLESDRILTQRFFAWIRSHPLAYLQSIGNETRRMLFKCEEYYPASPSARFIPLSNWLVRLERGVVHQPLWLLLALALPGAWAARRARFCLGLTMACLVVYLSVFPLLHIGFTRYTLPVLPWLLLLAANFLNSVVEGVQRRFKSC